MVYAISDIRLSIALVTCNRAESLERCLKSLRSQSLQPFEIVVSDDSEPDLMAEIQTIAKRWQCRYIIGPHRGLYANRNNAALACTGTHIRTMDDDHTFPPRHIEECLKAVYSDPNSIWTTGEVILVNDKITKKYETAGQLIASGVSGPVKDFDNNWAISDGSTIYPREVFLRGYRMVEDYSFGSSYLEFGAFLYYYGFRSRCIPGAFVEHQVDSPSLKRKVDITVLESRLYASLCFNLYFRPNLILAIRYICTYFIRSYFSLHLLLSLHKMIYKARKRWRMEKGE